MKNKIVFIVRRRMKPTCYFQIPRGQTNRYVYVFNYYKPRQAYRVTLKVLMANRQNYQIVSTVYVPQNQVMNYINTVVANTY